MTTTRRSETAALVESTMLEALAASPTDRSCWTCDYFHSGKCANNGRAEIPLPFRERGCEAHKEEGAPF
jgi:hypothetical protein